MPHDREQALALIAGLTSFLASAVVLAALVAPPKTQSFSENGKSQNENFVVISDDRGGIIDVYMKRWTVLSQMGFTIMVDGPCVSACTLIFWMVPRDMVCVTPRASFGFHQAKWGWFGPPNLEVTKDMYDHYPKVVRDWIDVHGPLGIEPIFMSGDELNGYFPPCYAEGQ